MEFYIDERNPDQKKKPALLGLLYRTLLKILYIFFQKEDLIDCSHMGEIEIYEVFNEIFDRWASFLLGLLWMTLIKIIQIFLRLKTL